MATAQNISTLKRRHGKCLCLDIIMSLCFGSTNLQVHASTVMCNPMGSVRKQKTWPFTCLIYVLIHTHCLYMLCLHINDACHIMPSRSTSVEVQNALSPKRKAGTCWTHPTPYTHTHSSSNSSNSHNFYLSTFISQIDCWDRPYRIVCFTYP